LADVVKDADSIREDGLVKSQPISMFMHAQKGKVVALAPTTTSEYHPVPRLSLFRAQQNNSKQVR
jgi:hypothetical protein